MKNRLCFIAFITGATISALACSSAMNHRSRWNGEFNSQIGMQNYTFDLEFVGSRIVGRITSPRGMSELQEGTLVGDKISFVEMMTDNDRNNVRVQYVGTIDGDQMKLTRIPGTYQQGTSIVQRETKGIFASLERSVGITPNSRSIRGVSQPARPPVDVSQ
jgi:hypothetical protein